MSFNQRELRKVKKLCQDVEVLINYVQVEIEEEDKQWQERNPDFPRTHAINASPSKTTGELRRRSMDLTRALADLRRYN